MKLSLKLCRVSFMWIRNADIDVQNIRTTSVKCYPIYLYGWASESTALNKGAAFIGNLFENPVSPRNWRSYSVILHSSAKMNPNGLKSLLEKYNYLELYFKDKHLFTWKHY